AFGVQVEETGAGVFGRWVGGDFVWGEDRGGVGGDVGLAPFGDRFPAHFIGRPAAADRHPVGDRRLRRFRAFNEARPFDRDQAPVGFLFVPGAVFEAPGFFPGRRDRFDLAARYVGVF